MELFFTTNLLFAIVLLYFFVVDKTRLTIIFKNQFSGKEVLVLLWFQLALIFPLFGWLIERRYKPHIFLGEGVSGVIFIPSIFAFAALCISVLPYLIIKRDYSIINKVIGILLCITGVFCAFIALLASDGSPMFAN